MPQIQQQSSPHTEDNSKKNLQIQLIQLTLSYRILLSTTEILMQR
jgi:hypothetical protein